jgi:hypothetical protein
MMYPIELVVMYGQYVTRWKWKLIREEPDIDEWGDEFEDRSRYRCLLLAELAKNPAAGLVEILPGVYRGPKPP